MTAPLMPKATAVWLVDNTTLTFRQIARFCELHELEIQAIADGDVASNIIGLSPVANGQLSKEEIKRCEEDPSADLVANVLEKNVKEINARNKKVLTPSQRIDKPSAILWLIHNCPELTNPQIRKLIGTTNPTIDAIRNGTREDMAMLRAKNPVAIGLCSETALDEAISAAKLKLEKDAKKKAPKKKAAKKTPKKKTAAKKTAKKATAKKTVAAKKKTAVKKTATKKTAAKKPAAKKATAKKAVKKTTAATKTAAAKKKTAVKKTAAKKTVVKKAASKKVAPKKATLKKAAPKKKTSKK
ncbi:MAG: DUF1013 domain-containing protein [Alphaproteobacteria bacterium]|nr:DUF1013 domain-containing protein [Alphaproteobacteria bacterium]